MSSFNANPVLDVLAAEQLLILKLRAKSATLIFA